MNSIMTRRRVVAVALAAMALGGAYLALRGPDGVVIGGPFSLVDGAGKPVHDTDFRGKYLIVYFGYTFCPDVCPTALGKLSSALDRLDKERLDKLAIVFISVDPKRDHGEKLAEYGHAFHPLITGLTGTREEIDKAVAAYGAKYQMAGDTSSDTYSVDHSSVIYVMGTDGKFITKFTHNTSPDTMLTRLEAVVK